MKFKRNNVKTSLKKWLTISQQKDILSINGGLSKDFYEVIGLWLKSRDTEEYEQVCSNNSKGNDFEFQVHLDQLLRNGQICSLHEGHFDWYIKTSVSTENLNEEEIQKLLEKEDVSVDKENNTIEYFIRLGRFQKTNIHGLQYVYSNEDYGICYLTQKGNVSFLLNQTANLQTKLQIDRVKETSNILMIEGKLFTKGSLIESSNLVLKSRNTNQEIIEPATFQLDKERGEVKYGLNQYDYTVTLDFQALAKRQNRNLQEDIYDFYFKITFHDQVEEQYIRIGRPTFRARHFLKESYSIFQDQVSIITPYYTFKGSNLSLEVFEYEKETFDFLQRKLKFAWYHRLLARKKDIWLVGERPYKAQDTGYHFFKYMRENHPDKNVYYVIEADSPERENVEPLGNVLIFKSKKHILYSLMAKRIIGSHHPDYLYPVRTRRFRKAVKGIKVFLQHGVMGTKNMVANYGKSAVGFETDMFLVSSQFEKEMIVNDFGYDSKDVFVTGLSRFDRLFAKDVTPKRQILIIPTWRDWITTDEAFLESDYFQRYKDLIYNQELHRVAKENNTEIILCLHPNMQKYTPFFADAPVRVINQGEIDVQHLLKESALMITDYSSVGFDFSFLYKPVLYYQFDRDRFIGNRPSHLDLDNDLPGDIVFELDPLLAKIKHYVEHDFKASDENKKRADKFLTFRDQNASKRIFEAIKEYNGKNKLEKAVESDLWIGLFNRFRKSKYYFPTMKAFYKIARVVLPVDKNLILFESGVGKQFADSPRVIYEELVRRNLPYKKVWVLNKNVRFTDKTEKIKRLSPKYYYYLARAGYWINNQNFPTYIKKRQGTTYIQTWHGTPLKKMLFDIEQIQGRDDTYLERVYQATQNWDYLISPSKYATDAFRSAFRYNGNILETGYPRNDIFYHKESHVELSKRIKKQIGVPEDKKMILYAPTFRDNDTKGKNKFLFHVNMDLEQMKEQLGDEYILLMRMHVVISNKLNIPEELQDFVYNVSSYSDIQELCLVSDILMTDYSSVMFDYANTNRPLLFYTYDLEEYKNNIRGFYMEFEEEAPGPFLFDTNDIINAVKNIDQIQVDYEAKYQAFRNKYCSLEDGNAGKRIVDQFFDKKS